MSASSQSRPVVTRFAPSPTGFLHIGGARTALFNWLFARANGGRFRLRIEDTDRKRSTDEAIAAILDGMRWLGLDWDGEEVYQSRRAGRHAEVARDLLERGKAYRCWMSQEELAGAREKARREKRPFRIDSPWRERESSGEGKFVVRLKALREGEMAIDDAVQGRVTVKNSEIDDFVLLRSDGTPTYMLAVVVDDHDMGVTHIIRGDDHLNNAFRQRALIGALGWPERAYAHVPLIHGADGAKLSKRHGALGIEAYRDETGVLPEAMFNYLLRLGWGHGDEEIVARERAVEIFDLADIGRSPARFDMRKLESLNAHYLREADDARLAELAAPRVEKALGRKLKEAEHERLAAAMSALKPRARSLVELAQGAVFLFAARPLDMDERAAALLEEGEDLLAPARDALAGLSDWTAEGTEAAIREAAAEAGVKLGAVAQPLRAALTGRAVSPGIFDVLILLGREESFARIEDRIDRGGARG
ncbi:MAG: glutamate--tRNA ligase [Sphingomonadaceae bacterium]